MEFNERSVKKFSILFIIAALGVLAYLIIRPVLEAVIGALILSYLFMPLYRKLLPAVRNRTLAASLVSAVLILIIVIPTWFLIPIVVQQIFAIFKFSQSIDIGNIINALFPTASAQFSQQAIVAISSFINKVSTAALNGLVGVFLDVPTITLNLFIACFVFFFALRDGDQLREFFVDLSPFSETKERVLVKHFRDITDSVIYGQIIIGLVQGALAGLGFLMFGIKNALVLTILATLLSITPIVGPFIVWIPIAIYLFASGNTNIAFGYLLYNLLIVSTVDNILRSYLVSRRTNLSPAVIFVGMMGGLFVFGVMGLILGPLILAYFLLFLKSYKDKTLYSLFSDRRPEQADT
ncbi:MAG TPA: AI-2E family transporter [Candidatus Nanoarchaeia archaeon]|nr:AI-2E family transporter [Candidatus Nanoarchaeia archaeon]